MTGAPANSLERQLRELVANGYGDPAIKFVLTFGRSFRGVERPREFRRRAPKACFRNAALLAFDGRGDYVEGFASCPLSPEWPKHHAWITTDGQDATDVTWSNPESCAYFGVVIDGPDLGEMISQTRYWGVLNPVHPSLAERLAHAARIRQKLASLLAIRGRVHD